MRRSWLVGGGALALAATALFLLPSVSLAQRRGGWGGGGGRGWGGYGYGGYNDGYGYGRGGYGSPYGGYYGYNRGWYSPNVYNYDYTPSYSFDSGDYFPPAGGETYYGGGGVAMDQGNMPAQNMSSQDPNKAHILLRVPSNAQVTFEGQATTSQGTVRAYASPPIDPNKDFTYHVKAQWTQDGRPVTQERQVRVHAGRQARVDFMQAQGRQPAYGAEPGMENEELIPPAERGIAPAPGTRNDLPRTDQNRTDQNRTDQNRTDQNRTDQNRSSSPTGNQNAPGTKTTPPAGSSKQNPSNP